MTLPAQTVGDREVILEPEVHRTRGRIEQGGAVDELVRSVNTTVPSCSHEC